LKSSNLLGESGAGKSTLIDTILHIAPEYHPGTVSGRFIHDPDDGEHETLKITGNRIGLVFQNPDSQFCTYTVVDELAFALENKCISPAHIDAEITRISHITGITHLRNRTLHSLSGGEKQKVAVAAILMQNPPMLIFDEPSANLDPESTRDLMALIISLQKNERKTKILNGSLLPTLLRMKLSTA
jgi:energy-coupling factor transport system ATP-binding protein